MNCQQFDNIIVNLACGPALATAEHAQALAHAQTCAPCGWRLACQHNVAAGLQVLAVQEQAISAPAHLAVALQAAFERQPSAAQTILSPAPVRHWGFAFLNWRWAVALAALLVVSGAVATVLWHMPSDELSPPAEVLTQAVIEPPQNLVANHAGVTGEKYVTKSRAHQRPKTTRRESEEFGALISLMPIAQTEAEEVQQVVRMQIPRSTLRLWGLPLNEESSSEQVSAEVYFSEDGVARAIRLRN